MAFSWPNMTRNWRLTVNLTLRLATNRPYTLHTPNPLSNPVALTAPTTGAPRFGRLDSPRVEYL